MKIVLNETYFKVLQQEPILYGKEFSASNRIRVASVGCPQLVGKCIYVRGEKTELDFRQCDYSDYMDDVSSIYKALKEFCEHFNVPLVVLDNDSQRRVEI